MPITPRSGAHTFPLALSRAGFYGLNKQAESTSISAQWATEADNAVFDTAGRLAARKGFDLAAASAISGTPEITQIVEYKEDDATTEIIFSADNSKFYANPTTPSDITGTATVTLGVDWQFANFAGKLIGVYEGENPVVYSGTAFSDITASSGTVPKGNCLVSFSGRVWIAMEGGLSFKYSALLDETAWSTGAGSVDMTSVWPNGQDFITALAVYNNRLVVFGRNSIVFYGDNTGSVKGIDPSNMTVVDTISGIGCIARDSIQEVEGGDFLFLSNAGVQSLGKLIQERTNPIDNVSKNIRTYFMTYVNSLEDTLKIKSAYSPRNSMYLISLPTTGHTFYFDTQGKLEDGALRVTEWHLSCTALCSASDGTLYLAEEGTPGYVSTYTGYSDNGESYQFVYKSSWLDFSSDSQDLSSFIKILKGISAVIYSGSSADVLFTWSIDFSTLVRSVTLSSGYSGGTSEWGVAEWGLGEWSSPSTGLSVVRGNGYGSGQYYKVGLQSTVNGSPFAIQHATTYMKIGRLLK